MTFPSAGAAADPSPPCCAWSPSPKGEDFASAPRPAPLQFLPPWGRGTAKRWRGVAAALLLAGCVTSRPDTAPERRNWVAVESGGGLSDAALSRVLANMSPSTRALARRFDPRPHADLWGRPVGWAVFDLAHSPSLGAQWAAGDDARRINALLPTFRGPNPSAKPFVLSAVPTDREKALQCLTQAVYYEAASESDEGQAAVAQVVLNRLRHPAFPKSVCGVVYEGSQARTGCQFSFTCDGSLNREPSKSGWARAQGAAKRALAGYVAKAVGEATHYHADYVSPYWAATLVKITQIGARIFYRWTGPSGTPGAFNGRYAGRENILPRSILQGGDPNTAMGGYQQAAWTPSFTEKPLGMIPTFTKGPRAITPATQLAMRGGRRLPTADEIAKINAQLAKAGGAPAAAAPAEATPAPYANGLPLN